MKQSFITSYLTFYMKASIALEGGFIKTSNPNSILKVIPLGSSNKTISVEQISSVSDSFSLEFKSFAWGILFTIIGLNMINNSLFGGLILVIYGILTILSSFQTSLELHLTSGQVHRINAIIFEKSNLISCKETIETFIQGRLNDTNVSANTDRIINALHEK